MCDTCLHAQALKLPENDETGGEETPARVLGPSARHDNTTQKTEVTFIPCQELQVAEGPARQARSLEFANVA